DPRPVAGAGGRLAGVRLREPRRAGPDVARIARGAGGQAPTVRALAHGRAEDRPPYGERGRGELEDPRRELQRVPPLPDRSPRAVTGRACVRKGNGVRARSA